MIVRNGDANSPYGGMRLMQLSGLSQMISFVTVAFNQCSGTVVPPGIASDAALAIDSSIVTDNLDTAVPPPQLCSTCTATYSLFSGTPPTGEGNIAGPAGFVDEAANDFHLMASSPARDAANPAATVLLDLDSNARPLGNGFDIGADEIVP